jgi:acetyl esterase
MRRSLAQVQTTLARPLFRAPPILRRWVTARAPVIVGEHPLDETTQHVLWVIRRGSRPLHRLGLREARRIYDDMPRMFDEWPTPVVRREVAVLPGPVRPLQAWVYRPARSGVLPVLVYLHGGGGVVGSPRSHDGVCRFLAEHAECLVVSVDYRLAPEHPFPAAVEDADAAFVAVVDRAARWGGDPRRVAIGGDSMGANLSAVVSMRRRDRGGPLPWLQLLVYPPTHAYADLPSRRDLGDGFILTTDLIRWFRDCYIGTADPFDPCISPLLAPHLGEQSPAIVVTAGYDPLRDEGDAYAHALAAAGVPTRHLSFPSLVHSFVQMLGVVPAARAAMHEIAGVLREGFAGEETAIAGIEAPAVITSRP